MSTHQQSGVISLVTSIMVSVMVATIAIALVFVSYSGTQQSSDDELSLRANAQAMGAVEYAYWAATNPSSALYHQNYSNDCVGRDTQRDISTLNATAANSNGVVCVTVNSSAAATTGVLNAANAQEVIIPDNIRLQDIELSWFTPGDVTLPGVCCGYSPVTNPLPASGIPGVELTIVNYSSTAGLISPGGSSLANIHIKNVVLLPNNTPAIDANNPTEKILVQCSAAATPYLCSSPAAPTIYASATANAAEPINTGTIIYIRALYPTASGIHYAITCLRTTSNSCYAASGQQVTIDVTAHAGPDYRRIEAVSSPPTGGGVSSGLNYVLFSDTNICKDFYITEAPDGSQLGQVNSYCGGTP